MKHLNEGKGVCSVEHTLTLKLSKAAELYGLTTKLTDDIVSAVHSVNRENTMNERLAIAFSELGKSPCLGGCIQVFGKKHLLEMLLQNAKIKTAFATLVF